MTEAQVINGCKKAKEHKTKDGYFKLGDLINLSRETRVHPCHKPYTALPYAPSTVEDRRKALDDFYRECPDMCPEHHKERLGI